MTDPQQEAPLVPGDDVRAAPPPEGNTNGARRRGETQSAQTPQQESPNKREQRRHQLDELEQMQKRQRDLDYDAQTAQQNQPQPSRLDRLLNTKKPEPPAEVTASTAHERDFRKRAEEILVPKTKEQQEALGKTGTVELTAQTDQQLAEALIDIQRYIEDMLADHPNHPQANLVFRTLNKLMGSTQDPGLLRKRYDLIVGIRQTRVDRHGDTFRYNNEDNIPDRLRIFHTAQERMLALQAVELHELYLSYAVATSPGGNPIHHKAVTEYAQKTGIQSLPANKQHDILYDLDRLRTQVYESMGLDFPRQMDMIGLNIHTIDPAAQPYDGQLNTFQFINNRQIAMKHMVEAAGAKSLLELPAEQQLDIITRAYEQSSRTLQGEEFAAVINELNNQAKTEASSYTTTIVKLAEQTEKGDFRKTIVTEERIRDAVVDRDQKIATRETVAAKHNRLQEAFEEVKKLDTEIEDVNNAIADAQETINEGLATFGHADIGQTIRACLEAAKENRDGDGVNIRSLAEINGDIISKQDIINQAGTTDTQKVQLRQDIAQLQKQAEFQATTASTYQELADAYRNARKTIHEKSSDRNNKTATRNELLAEHFAGISNTRQDRWNALATSKTILETATKEETDAKETLKFLGVDQNTTLEDVKPPEQRSPQRNAAQEKQDRKTGRAMRYIALANSTDSVEITTETGEKEPADGRFITILSELDKSKIPQTHEDWCRLFFGVHKGAELDLTKRILTKSEMVLIAHEVFNMSEQFWGYDDSGQSQIKNLQTKKTKGLGTKLFPLIQNRLTANPMDARAFTLRIQEYLREKALARQPLEFATDLPAIDRRIEHPPVHVETPDGIVDIDRKAVDPTVSIETRDTLRITGDVVDIPYHIDIQTNGDVGTPNSATIAARFRWTEDIYRALPSNRPARGFPRQLLDRVYDATGNKRRFTDIELQYVTARQQNRSVAGSISRISTDWSNLGKFDNKILRSVGHMVGTVDDQTQRERFRRFTPLARLFNAGTNVYSIARDRTDGLIYITMANQRTKYSDFLNTFSGTRDELDTIKDQVGQEALLALQRR